MYTQRRKERNSTVNLSRCFVCIDFSFSLLSVLSSTMTTLSTILGAQMCIINYYDYYLVVWISLGSWYDSRNTYNWLNTKNIFEYFVYDINGCTERTSTLVVSVYFLTLKVSNSLIPVFSRCSKTKVSNTQRVWRRGSPLKKVFTTPVNNSLVLIKQLILSFSHLAPDSFFFFPTNRLLFRTVFLILDYELWLWDVRSDNPFPST